MKKADITIPQKSREIQETMGKAGLAHGRLLSMSKSGYVKDHPGHQVFFNAWLCSKDAVVWMGDIDLTMDTMALKSVAALCKQNLYLVQEQHAITSQVPMEVLIKKAVKVFYG